jgi:ATP-dependent Clp protease ATP-binding subunit ClpX
MADDEGPISNDYSQRKADLAKCLDGLLLSDPIETWSYQGPFYVLPVEVHEEHLVGYFFKDEGNFESTMGFKTSVGPLTANYHEPLILGNWASTKDPGIDEVYIPLRESRLKSTQKMSREAREAGVTPRNRQFPFKLMEVSNGDRSYPLLTLMETDDGPLYRGLYRDDDGELQWTEVNFLDLDIRKELYYNVKQHWAGEVKTQVPVKTPVVAKSPAVVKAPAVIVKPTVDIYNPKAIVGYLDRFVVAQTPLKRRLAVAAMRYAFKVRDQNDKLKRKHILIAGPTGSGKTYTAEMVANLLSKTLGIPAAFYTSTGKSSTGFVGDNLIQMFRTIRRNSDPKILAPYGVMVVDEIGKLARGKHGFRQEMQDEMVGWLGGTTVLGESGSRADMPEMDTRNLLFITMGAFQDVEYGDPLTEIIRARIGGGKRQIGFGTMAVDARDMTDTQLISRVAPADIIEYGLKPELVGRLGSLVYSHLLSQDQLEAIVTTAEDSVLSTYMVSLGIQGFGLSWDKEVPAAIIAETPSGTGARALDEVCERLFVDIEFSPEDYSDGDGKIHITAEQVGELLKADRLSS